MGPHSSHASLPFPSLSVVLLSCNLDAQPWRQIACRSNDACVSISRYTEQLLPPFACKKLTYTQEYLHLCMQTCP